MRTRSLKVRHFARFLVAITFFTLLSAQTSSCAPTAPRVCDGSGLSGACQTLSAGIFWSVGSTLPPWTGGASIEDTISSMEIPANWVVVGCSDTNFAATCMTFNGPTTVNLDASLNNRISSLHVVFAPPFWTSANYDATSPFEVANEWSDEVQGLAHDSAHWYVSENSGAPSVRSIVFADGLASNGVVVRTWDQPDDCGHLGDIDVHDNAVYAPLHDCPGIREARIDVLDVMGGTLVRTRSFLLPEEYPKAGWVAVHPTTGQIFIATSLRSNTIAVFDSINGIVFDSGDGRKLLNHLYDITIPTLWDAERPESNGIQGGAFAPHGRLYLSVSDDDDTCGPAGLYAFDLRGATATLRHRDASIGTQPTICPADQFNPNLAHSDEFEGIDIFDVSAATMPGVSGQIHYLVNDNDKFSRDDVYGYHVSVNDPLGL